MAQLSYSLMLNGMPCEVQIETADTKAAITAPARPTFQSSGQTASAYPVPAYAYAQPTQATWVTARRVAHLPFH